MLFVSGLLNPKMGGPGINPPLPPGAGGGGRAGGVRRGFASATGGAGRGSRTSRSVRERRGRANRRSVYIFLKRNAVYPMLEAFDAPNPQESCSRRFRSVIPSQSLILMNDPLVLEWSRALAGRVLERRRAVARSAGGSRVPPGAFAAAEAQTSGRRFWISCGKQATLHAGAAGA